MAEAEGLYTNGLENKDGSRRHGDRISTNGRVRVEQVG